MLENREDPGAGGEEPAGVEEEEESEEQEMEESPWEEMVWVTQGFFSPWRITTNVSNPKAAFITSWNGETMERKWFIKKNLQIILRALAWKANWKQN